LTKKGIEGKNLSIGRHEIIFLGLFALVLLMSASILGGAPSASLLGGLSPVLILAFMTWYLILLVANRTEIIAAIAGMLKRRGKEIDRKVNFLVAIVAYIVGYGLILLFFSSGLGKRLVSELQGVASSLETGNSTVQFTQTNPTNPFPVTPFLYYGIAVFSMIFLVTIFIFIRGVHMAVQNRGRFSEEEVEGETKRKSAEAVQQAILGLKTTKEYREIILQCYRRMCTILADSGILTSQSETAREFASSISSKLQMSAEAVRGLTFLFEEARYSDHQITDEKRTAALNHLQSLQQALSINAAVSA
jgi:hypothetical protein